jgi:hypothetical protein
MLTFSQPVFTDGSAAQVSLVLDSGTIITRYNGPVTVSSNPTGDGTTKVVFQYKVKATDGVAAGNFAVGHLSGVHGSSTAALNAPDVITSVTVSAFTVNLPTITSVDGITNAHHYLTGDIVSLAAHFSEAVVVTGVPQIAIPIHLTTRQATYVSGSGTNALLFQYTTVSGDVATAGQVSVTSPIALNSGTILGNGAAATLSFTPPTVTTVTFN